MRSTQLVPHTEVPGFEEQSVLHTASTHASVSLHFVEQSPQ